MLDLLDSEVSVGSISASSAGSSIGSSADTPSNLEVILKQKSLFADLDSDTELLSSEAITIARYKQYTPVQLEPEFEMEFEGGEVEEAGEVAEIESF